jgi:DMSO/TMAO reductase YedYZ molybdopterin-dependent catalytic subunit
MKQTVHVSVTLILCFGLLQIKAAEKQGAASVAVSGAVKTPLTLSARDLLNLPRSEATVNEHGKPVNYEGVLVSEILKKAGAPVGEELRGKALATYVLATGSDGYQVVYSLAELDPALTQAKVLLADKTDGKPLPDSAGPFRLVAPDDKKMARSVRMLEKLEVVRLQP